MGRTAAVLFDVDGTLVDTNYLHAVAWWRAFRACGLTVPMHRLHDTVGQGSDQFVSTVLGGDVEPGLHRALDAAHTHFYGPDLHGLTPLPGAAELLRAVARLGPAVVLASSCSQEEAGYLRAAIDADEVITAMTHAAAVEATKPRPDLIEAAMAEVGLAAAQVVFVGDTVWDARACAAAGVNFIGVRCGGICEDVLREAGARAVYRDPQHLLDELDASPIAALAKANPTTVGSY